MKIMASGPITTWKTDGETLETVRAFIFLGSKITADGECSHEVKRPCSLEEMLWQTIDSILKSRDITLQTKVSIIKAMVFPVVMYRYKNWTRKKAEHQRKDAFELWCWRRLLRISWTASKSNQSTLKESNPEYSLKGLMLTLKLQYFGQLMCKNWLIGKDPDAGKNWRQEEKGGGNRDEMVGYCWPVTWMPYF